jgi:Pyruvate/2-oxoglutarate dehydrogenase complex, dihydrolipoamide acyltransferase (E2) component, and related enzymes
MANKLIAPAMGEGVEELTVVNWLKKEGDPVKEMESIVELETDKVTTDIPSPAAGTLLKIIVPKDEIAKVGSVLAWIGQPGEALDSAASPTPAAPAAAAPAPMPAAVTPAAAVSRPAPTVVAAATAEYTGPVSPLVKKLVALNNIDLNQVQGTGLDGRITKDDVMHYLETRKTSVPAVTATPAAVPAPVPSAPRAAPVEVMPEGGQLVPHTNLRRQIAERMVNSVHTSPHVMTVMEADLGKVLAHRAANKAAFAAGGVNLTLTAYFAAAIVAGLKACPYVNSSWTEEGIQYHSVINLGIATALDDGLIVPVIKNADLLSLQGLAHAINDLSGRARAKKLLPDEVKGGTFTLTNNGSSGSLFASPIILQPQAGILGTGIMQKRAVVLTDAAGNDSIAIRPMVYLSFVFDHRIMDGETGDRFLKAVKTALENWA